MRDIRTSDFYRMRLPHWEVDRGVYFINLRLAGTLPRDVVEKIKGMAFEAENGPDSNWHGIRKRMFRAIDDALDSSREIDFLARPDVADVCVDAIENRAKRGIWRAVEYVVMPNHLHLFTQLHDRGIRETMVAFKRWTARAIKPLLNLEREALWQREWFDHWSRTPEEDEQLLEYIRQNPVKAGLVKHYRDWPYGSWRNKKT